MDKKGEKCAFQTQCKLENRDSRAKRMFFSTNLSSLSIYFLRDHAYFSLLSFLRRNSSNTLKSMANNAITSHHYHISPFSSKTLFASRTLMVRQRSVVHPGDWRRLPRVPIGLSAKWCWETLACNQDNSSLAFWYFICIFYMVIIIKSIKNYSNFIQYWFLTTSWLFFLNIGGIVNSSTVMIYGFSLLHPRNARVLYTDPFIHHLNKPVWLPVCLSVEVVVKLFTNWPRSTWTDNVVYQATTRYYEWYTYLGRGIICRFRCFFNRLKLRQLWSAPL